jgi:PP-loop superfamily ATP-utilizing enzyme
MIERAEAALKRRGFRELRVRHHEAPPRNGNGEGEGEGALARIEVPLADVPRLSDAALQTEITRELTDIGYARVEIDPRGLRPGRLNEGRGTTEREVTSV